MTWLHDISYVFGGAFLANAIPHLVSGIQGRAFQSPFAMPPGEGLSSSTLNVVRAFFNLAVGYHHPGCRRWGGDCGTIADMIALIPVERRRCIDGGIRSVHDDVSPSHHHGRGLCLRGMQNAASHLFASRFMASSAETEASDRQELA